MSFTGPIFFFFYFFFWGQGCAHFSRTEKAEKAEQKWFPCTSTFYHLSHLYQFAKGSQIGCQEWNPCVFPGKINKIINRPEKQVSYLDCWLIINIVLSEIPGNWLTKINIE